MGNPVSLAAKADIAKALQHYDGKLRGSVLSRAVGGNINWAGIFTQFITTVTQIVSQVVGTPGDKEAAVEEAAMTFWKQTVEPILAQQVGSPWIFNTFIAPMIEKEIPVIVAGLYEAVSQVLTKIITPPTGAMAVQTPYTLF